jgi:hypothetical protein
MTNQDTEIPEKFRDWREARRFRAWELHLKGWTQARVAEALGQPMVQEGAQGRAAVAAQPQRWRSQTEDKV